MTPDEAGNLIREYGYAAIDHADVINGRRRGKLKTRQLAEAKLAKRIYEGLTNQKITLDKVQEYLW